MDGSHPDAPAGGATALLALVRAVAAEAQPHRPPPPVQLDSSLERDLGLDSLGRAELLLRVEAELGTALPARVLGEAETPRDLLRALASARQRSAGDDGALLTTELASAAPLADGRDEGRPERAGSLLDVLRWHAERHAQRTHVRLLDEERGDRELSYGALLQSAQRIAAGLLADGLAPGERVSLMLATGLDYFACFLGVQLAGGVPVPLYPPARPSQLEDHLRRQAGILNNAGVRVLVAAPEVRPLLRLLSPLAPDLRALHTVEELDARSDDGARLPPVGGGDLAFLQYTSGSTGAPKGVALTHENLLANLRSVGRVVHFGGEDAVVSWLPLYHDMGLIGAWMGSLYFGMPLVLMSPLAFLARPVRWLQALTRYGGTISAAPNFAYALCTRKVPDDELETLDLARWRIAMNGAEPVSAEVCESFARRFAPCGFRRRAMMPVYGLAECSLALAFTPPGRGPRIETLDREALQRDGEARPARDDDSQPLRVVAAGEPIPAHELRVVDDGERELPERREGRLQFRGPSATSGYFRNAEATARLVRADGWLDTGDLGFVAEGEVFVTGRRKDVIIRGGRNVHPQELEEAVGTLAGLRRGCVAAFAITDAMAGTERLVVMAERAARAVDSAADEELRQRVAELSIELTGMAPDEVTLVPPSTVPKTSSGKIRREAARALWSAGLATRPRGVRWQLARLGAAGLLPRWRRAWRRTGELAWGVWSWLALALLGVPTYIAALVLPTLRARRGAARLGARAVAALCGVPLVARGLERLPASTCVLACNHQSYLDGFVLAALLPPRFGFLVKAELGRLPWTRWPLQRLGAVFVERADAEQGAEDTRRAEAAVRDGDALVVFPEGTFRRAPGLLPFRMGGFAVAARNGTPVVPAALRGSRSVLRAGRAMPSRGPVTLTVGLPIAPAGNAWRDAVALRDAARAWILAHAAEPDLG